MRGPGPHAQQVLDLVSVQQRRSGAKIVAACCAPPARSAGRVSRRQGRVRQRRIGQRRQGGGRRRPVLTPAVQKPARRGLRVRRRPTTQKAAATGRFDDRSDSPSAGTSFERLFDCAPAVVSRPENSTASRGPVGSRRPWGSRRLGGQLLERRLEKAEQTFLARLRRQPALRGAPGAARGRSRARRAARTRAGTLSLGAPCRARREPSPLPRWQALCGPASQHEGRAGSAVKPGSWSD